MEQIAVKKEFHECNVVSTVSSQWTPSVSEGQAEQPVDLDNVTVDSVGASPLSVSESVEETNSQGDSQGEITTSQGEITTSQGEVTISQGEVTILQGEVTISQGEITTLQGEITTLQGEITTLQGEITTLQGEITIKREEIDLPDCEIEPEMIAEPSENSAVESEMIESDEICAIEPSMVTKPSQVAVQPKIELRGVSIKQEKIEVYNISSDSDSDNDEPDSTLTSKPPDNCSRLQMKSTIQPGSQNVENLSKSCIQDDMDYSAEKMKIIPGKLAVCDNCGFFSMDFNRCFRCRRELPPDCKVVDAQDAVNDVDKSKKQTYIKDREEGKLHIAGKKVLCPHCGCLSSNFRRCTQSRCRRYISSDVPEAHGQVSGNSERSIAGDGERESLENQSAENQQPINHSVENEPIHQSPEKLSSRKIEENQPPVEGSPDTHNRFSCTECPFVSSCQRSYLYHKQFHRSRGTAPVFKCPLCSYNVSQRRLLSQHLIVHVRSAAPSSLAGETEAMSATEISTQEAVVAAAKSLPRHPTVSHSKKRDCRPAERSAEPKLGHFAGKFKVCPYCSFVSSAISARCARSRCRRALPKSCSIIDTSEPSNEFFEKHTDSSLKTSRPCKLFCCDECPFESRDMGSLLYHKQFHRPRNAATAYKCSMCTYTVTNRVHLMQHMKVHNVNPSDQPITPESAKDDTPSAEASRSERSARKHVSYAEFDSSDDEPDGATVLNQTDDSWESLSKTEDVQGHDESLLHLDDLLFCYECERAWKGDCPRHGALIAIEDSIVPLEVADEIFAIRTAPQLVQIGNADTPEKANGIFSREKLPNRMRFGPLKGRIASIDDINSYTWLIRKDGKPSACVDLSEPGTSCWWRYVRIAKNEQEMNCAAYQYQGSLYVRTIRDISPKEEIVVGPYDDNGLLVKYDPELIKTPKVSSWAARHHKGSSKKKKVCVTKTPIRHTIRGKQPRTVARVLSTSGFQGSVRTNKMKTTYACTLCGKGFSEEEELKVHMRVHTAVEPYKCVMCDTRFTQEIDLKLHISSFHTIDEPFTPTGQSKKLNSKERQIVDNGVQAVKQSFVCSLCKQAFRYSFALKKHSQVHMDGDHYVCPECSERFSKMDDLVAHFCLHTGQETLVCNVCSLTFTAKADLDAHKRIHSEELPYKCTVCDRRFMQRRHLSNHLRSHMGLNRYACRICNLTFVRPSALKIHNRIHMIWKDSAGTEKNEQFYGNNTLMNHLQTDEKPFACHVCHQAFTMKSELQAHMRIHLKERPYKCSLCNQRFLRKCHLDRHHLSHTRGKELMCNICHKAFSRRDRLKKHVLSHAGALPFVCKVCNKSFSYKYLLTRHINERHKGVRKFVCVVCNQGFTCSANYKIHCQFQCTMGKRYGCPTCGMRFFQKGQLTIHLRGHTGETGFKCRTCDKSFISNYALRRHRVTHKACSCSQCGKRFSLREDLIIHERIHADAKSFGEGNTDTGATSNSEGCSRGPGSRSSARRPFACPDCDKRFSTKKYVTLHHLNHTGETKYACTLCPGGKPFTYKWNLNRHMKDQHPDNEHFL